MSQLNSHLFLFGENSEACEAYVVSKLAASLHFKHHKIVSGCKSESLHKVNVVTSNSPSLANESSCSDDFYFDGCDKYVAPLRGSCALKEQKTARSENFDYSHFQYCANSVVKNVDRSKSTFTAGEIADCLSKLGERYRLITPAKDREHLLLVTSPFNPQTLFYAELPNFPKNYVVSTDILPILSVLNPEVCKVALSFWLAGRPDPNLSLYTNIHQVPQGGFVLLTPKEEAKSGLYWDISSQCCNDEKDVSRQDTQTELLKLLGNSIDSLLPTDGDESSIFCQLSGGMDSTSVLAITQQKSQQRDFTVNSISHLYKHTESADEHENIKAMLDKYPSTHSYFLELDDFVNHSFSSLYPTHPQSPGMVMSPKYHAEAELMVKANAKTLFTGNGGDEMFWGHSLAYFDRLTSGNWGVINEVVQSAKKLNLPILKSLRSVFLGPMKQYVKSTLSGSSFEDKLASYVLPNWLTDSAKELIANAEQRSNPFASDKSNLARYARYEGLFQTSTFNPMRSYQAVFDEYGLFVKHPLFNSQIAQFSFNVPQHFHISGEYPKLLLRNTMDAYLPQQVCWNQKKTVFDQHFANLLANNQAEIRKLLQHEGLADLGLIDNKKVLATFDKVMMSQTPSLQVDLLYAILVQSWFQTHIA